MTAHRALNIVLTAGLTAAMAAILLAGPAIDGHADEWATSQALADAQRAARSEYLRERAVAKACTELRGPGAAWRWGENGDLICVDHRTGRAAVVVASKGGN